MRFFHCRVLALLMVFISACAGQPTEAPVHEIPSPTPFQPVTQDNVNSLYLNAAPTPLYLPSVTPLPPTPTEPVILPETLPTGVSVTSFTLPTDLDPLTGLAPSDPTLMDRRPLAIKVANYPRYIRPQSGLTLADNIFEYYIEAGLTRFIAVFYGNNSDWVGPVRSGRYFDENILRMYHAFLVFKFADPRVLTHLQTTSDIASFLVVPSLGSCPPFQLMKSRHIEVYNNSYFRMLLWPDCVARDGLDNQHQAIRNGFFNEAAPASDLLGTELHTYYSVDSYSKWVYDPSTKQYIRYQEVSDIRNDKPENYDLLVDQVTGQPVHASNVVYLMAYHTFKNTFDQEDEVYQIDLTGSGEAYFFRDGVGIPARWVRTNKDQPLLLTTLNGAPIYSRPGITFYEVLGSASYVDQDAGVWDFHHATP